MAKPLNERIASALSTDRVTLTDLARLVEDASTARDSAAARVEQATADSINFALSEADRDDAAAIADKARREAAALTAALEQLEAKLVAKREGEGVKAREAERAALLAERDELAERLRAEWPEIEARVLGLLSAIKANDERMKASGVHEASAEAVARGVDGTFRVGPSVVRRLTEMKIPSFADAPTELAWPPPIF